VGSGHDEKRCQLVKASSTQDGVMRRLRLENGRGQSTEELARATAAQTAELVMAQAERTQALAIERAVRDTNIDHDLREHQQHLEQINGSQEKMADSLEALKITLSEMADMQHRQTAASEAIGTHARQQIEKSSANRMFIIGLLAVLVPIVLFLIASGGHP
jgi:VIT1/CCC1 family predicted Fe2+/Mn2+ transporter